MKYRRVTAGFTIVELLIVIVVIAILAAISIVAYNGIQDRAARSAAISDVSNALKQAEVFKAGNNETYPTSITSCPSPPATALCLRPSQNASYIYKTSTSSELPRLEVASLNDRTFVYESKGEVRSSNEFLRYTDIAPYVDKYGLRPLVVEFDIRSLDTSRSSSMLMYKQNGSGTKYGGIYRNIPVTTSFVRHTIEFTPTVSNASLTESWLAFYGGQYGNGNVPVVQNLTISLK